jgi:hypothetical protein
MVGQPVGATGESPKDDRQSSVPRGNGPTQDARRHQILFLFTITFENAYNFLVGSILSKEIATSLLSK